MTDTIVRKGGALPPIIIDPERCRIWTINAGREDLVVEGPEYCNKNCKLCGWHFENIMFLNLERTRLHGHAVPTIFTWKSDKSGESQPAGTPSTSAVAEPAEQCSTATVDTPTPAGVLLPTHLGR